MSEAMEQLGEASDSLDSLIAAMQLPMPAKFHLDMLKATLPKIVEQMRAVYVAETGINPWSTHP